MQLDCRKLVWSLSKAHSAAPGLGRFVLADERMAAATVDRAGRGSARKMSSSKVTSAPSTLLKPGYGMS